MNLKYAYNPDGLVAAASPLSAPASTEQDYTYSSQNQLTAATTNGVVTQVPNMSYGYDPAGELTSRTAAAATMTYSYDAAGQLTASSGPAETTAYRYDGDGNRVGQTTTSAGQTVNNRTFTYDDANRLVGYAGPVVPNGTQSTVNSVLGYQYDGDGLRSDFVYDEVTNKIPTIIRDNLNHAFISGPGGMIIEELTLGRSPMYYSSDALGSTRLLTDSSARPVQTYSYNPYGRTVGPAVTSALNPIQWDGQYRDTSGLYYMLNRWYDPETAQFLTADPLALLTQQPYGMAQDDPVNITDPTGLCPGIAAPYIYALGATLDLLAVAAVAPFGYAIYLELIEEELTIFNLINVLAALGPIAAASTPLALASAYTYRLAQD